MPGNHMISIGLNPIENYFRLLKRKLEKEPTRSLEEAKCKVRELWTGMSNDYLFKLCSSMERRMNEV